MVAKTEVMIGLADAAQMLGIRYAAAYDLLLVGRLEGSKGPNGRWMVSKASVDTVRGELARRRA